MSTSLKNETRFPKTQCDLVRIDVDYEKIEALNNNHHYPSMALKNEEYGIGVFFTQDGYFGVYGNDFLSRAAINLYWELNDEQISQAFDDAENLEEAIEVANNLILGTIVEIMDS